MAGLSDWYPSSATPWTKWAMLSVILSFHWCLQSLFGINLPETNIAPENRPSQKEFHLPTINFQGYVSFREGMLLNQHPVFIAPQKMPGHPSQASQSTSASLLGGLGFRGDVVPTFLLLPCWFGVHHKHQPLHDRINPKDCQVASPLVIQGFSNFLGLFQVMKWQTPVICVWKKTFQPRELRFEAPRVEG